MCRSSPGSCRGRCATISFSRSRRVMSNAHIRLCVRNERESITAGTYHAWSWTSCLIACERRGSVRGLLAVGFFHARAGAPVWGMTERRSCCSWKRCATRGCWRPVAWMWMSSPCQLAMAHGSATRAPRSQEGSAPGWRSQGQSIRCFSLLLRQRGECLLKELAGKVSLQSQLLALGSAMQIYILKVPQNSGGVAALHSI